MVGSPSTLIATSAKRAAPIEPPIASIIVLARHSPTRLKRCLAALARLNDPISREVLLLLNGADVEMKAVVNHREVPSWLTVFESPLNLGFAAGCNVVAAAAVGRYLVFLNDDTEVEQGWLHGLVEVAESNQSVGAVGSCVLFPDGSVQEAGSIVWQDGSISSLGRGARPDSSSVSYVRQVDYCSACSLLVPREAWTAVGGFCQEYFPAYYEDVDLCFSLRAMGYRVMYAPRSRLMHEGGSSTEPGFRLFINNRHRQRFRQRWGAVLSSLEPPEPTSPAAVRRAAFRARGCPRRLLMVCDRLQPPSTDAQSDRIWSVVFAMANTYGVSLWTSVTGAESKSELSLHGVETIAGELAQHLNEPGVLYDAVLISTPDDFDRYGDLVRRSQPHSVLIYDAAVVHHRQRGLVARNAEDLAKMRTLEETLRARADFVTCASDDVKAFFCTTVGAAAITIVSPHHCPAAAPTVSIVSPSEEGSWKNALGFAQLKRANKTHTGFDSSVRHGAPRLPS